MFRIFSASLLCVAIFTFLGASQGSAQQIERSFEFQLTPQFPNPGETVRIYAQTFSFDIRRADTTWRVNGEVVEQGRGIQSIEVVVGNIGETTTVSLFADRNGDSISEEIELSGVAVDLIVEPQTYTPPLYRGRALPTHESDIRVVANVASGGGYSPEDFIYTWRVNGAIQGFASGAGRNVLETSADPLPRSVEIRVDVESIDGLVTGREELSVQTIGPQVLLYVKNPLLGLDTTTILANETELAEDEVTISAEPFYVPGILRENLPIRYVWRLNGNRVETSNQDQGTITLRQAGNGRGQARVQVNIEHPREVLLRGNDSAVFTFGIENTGLFNF